MHKKSAYFLEEWLRINSDGTSILDRKPCLNLKPNHYKYQTQPKRMWNSAIQGQAIKDERGWYKRRK